MKLPAIFELTKREQRTVILIVIALLAVAIVKHYRDQQQLSIPVMTSRAGPSITPSPTSVERENDEPGE